MSFYLAKYKLWRMVETGEERWNTGWIAQEARADSTQTAAFT